MPRYITNEGEIIEARDARHLVEKLRRQSYSKFATTADYMRDMAERMTLIDAKVHIDTRSPERFVSGLIDTGFLKIKG